MFKHLCSEASVAVMLAPQEPLHSYSRQISVFQEPPFTSLVSQVPPQQKNDSVTNMVYLSNHKEVKKKYHKTLKILSEMSLR